MHILGESDGILDGQSGALPDGEVGSVGAVSG
jgi:hypothetical protein